MNKLVWNSLSLIFSSAGLILMVPASLLISIGVSCRNKAQIVSPAPQPYLPKTEAEARWIQAYDQIKSEMLRRGLSEKDADEIAAETALSVLADENDNDCQTMGTKRKIEIFSAGCATCREAIEAIKQEASPSWDIIVLDMMNTQVARRAKGLGVRSVPAVLIDGKLASCSGRGVDIQALRDAGLGRTL